MKIYNKVVIGDGERGLEFVDRRLVRVLAPGVYHRIDPLGRTRVVVHDIAQPEYRANDRDALIAALGERLSEHFVLADIGTESVGLVSRNGRLTDVLAPGTRALYWKGLVAIEVETVSLDAGLEVPRAIAQRLRQAGVLERHAAVVTVPVESTGLVFIDGELAGTLGPGSYAWWNFRRNVVAEVIDQRLISLEVSGQELLTRDKVSLRVNLGATLRIADPVLARTRVAKHSEYLYRELQFGLRQAIAAKTLDELLGDKASLDADIAAWVRARVSEFGIEVRGVGVKDVILPGEMKEILNGVVQAEKQAQANVIRRREEANATRSLLNTAKLIEENPTLLRMKELEALEKVTEKIGQLTVFGGLDGVMQQLVKLR